MDGSPTERLLARYDGNRVIRGLLQLVPLGVGGAVDVVLTKTLDKMREERVQTFFDELANRTEPLDPKVLESEDFLHCYFATTRYALNSRRREKIEMFARLLQSSLTEIGPKDVDEYEEFLSILDELSYRELRALAILDTFSGRPRTSDQNELQWTYTFWEEFEQRIIGELGVPADEVDDAAARVTSGYTPRARRFSFAP